MAVIPDFRIPQGQEHGIDADEVGGPHAVTTVLPTPVPMPVPKQTGPGRL